MFVSDEKSCKMTGVGEDSQVPFTAELKKFFTLSRECQTQFSHTEAYHRSRKFQFHEGDLIKEFITYTMLFKKCNEGATTLNADEEGVVKNITERMIEESKKHNCEVHFDVIWVYYFTYRDEEINSLPIFKIHKARSNEAVYLDAFSKVYQTWNCYIDGPGLGKSLLCVPRNGEYCLDGGELNLEFVLTKDTQLECKSDSRIWVKHVAPLSQGLQNWVRQVRSWLSNHPEIYSVVKKFQESTKENNNVVLDHALSLICAFFQPELTVNIEFAKLCFQAAKIAFIYIKSQGYFEIFSKYLGKIYEFLAKYLKYHPEAKEILQILNKPSRDWVEILDSICCLIKKIKHQNCQ